MQQLPPSLAKMLLEAMTSTSPRDRSSPSTERVWIVQCHCPQNHWIRYATFAATFDPSWLKPDDSIDFHRLPRDLMDLINRSLDSLSFDVEDAIVDGSLASLCPVCGAGAPTWHYCSGLTQFDSLDEARSNLGRVEAREAAMAVLAATHRKREARRNE